MRVFDTEASAEYKRSIQYVWVVLPKQCASFRASLVEMTEDIDLLFQKHAAGAAVVTSGGFRLLEDPNKAEGLHVSGSKLLRPRHETYEGGFLVQAKDGVRIHPVSTSTSEMTRFAEVIQSRPIFLHRGSSAIKSDDFARANRVAVLVGNGGNIGILGAFGPTGSQYSNYSLYELALLAEKLAKGSSLEDAWGINLEGGPAAMIYLPVLKKRFGVTGKRNVASLALLGRQP